jgi:predicted RNase H-like nuclease (RuvC/YqgF family)
MNAKSMTVERLREAATKAAARVAAAKDEIKAVKSRLKQARKAFKAEKRAAKQLRRNLKDAVSARLARPPKTARRPKPALSRKTPIARAKRKAATRRAPDTLRSAAEVAKSVIERLQAPPPLLPPAPVISQSLPSGSGSSTSAPGKS